MRGWAEKYFSFLLLLLSGFAFVACEDVPEPYGINLEAAKVRADITRVRGEAEAKARFLVENERALGVKRRADVFDKPSALADLRFVESLGPDFSIRVLHSGEGTLWTDLKSPTLTIPAK